MNSYIGLMSGTSMDAIDAALVRFEADVPHLIAHHSQPLPAEIRPTILRVAAGQPVTAATIGALDAQLGDCFAHAVLALLHHAKVDPDTIAAIGSHGQTLFHSPNTRPAFSWQIGDPNIIAERTGITTIADFRRRDVAAGGQGAPLVPAFHQAVFGKSGCARAVVNIGGIANVTLLPGEPAQTRGFDTGPGNCLLDAWCERYLGHAFDQDGRWGANGKVNETLLQRLLADPYFSAAPPKSSGREYFNLDWLTQQQSDDTAQNIQATLCALTAESISAAIKRYAPATREVYVCGGGAHNRTLMQQLATRLGNTIRLDTTLALGVDPGWVEAMAFAWLAKQTLSGLPGNLPGVTGAQRPVILGAIYPA
ncbi:MAG: anhydro-N-acetylmuramic acid kinase [Gammaproteobacteria bacterium]|nr:anhydro-N-acetylmuramic acid kinase [Gammaproteobacteria bacterium]